MGRWAARSPRTPHTLSPMDCSRLLGLTGDGTVGSLDKVPESSVPAEKPA